MGSDMKRTTRALVAGLAAAAAVAAPATGASAASGDYTEEQIRPLTGQANTLLPACRAGELDGTELGDLCRDTLREIAECKAEGNLTDVRFLTEAGEIFKFRLPAVNLTACVTSELIGGLSSYAEVQQCKLREPEFGGYPYRFYGEYLAEDRGDCVRILGQLGRAEIPVPDGSIPRPVLESGELENPGGGEG